MNSFREIKFRMWSKEAKKFFCDPENVYECLKFSKIPDTSKFYNDMVWQQFTGLLDKNSKEIYEGDVVKGLFKDTEYNHWEETTAPVLWLNRLAGFNLSLTEWDRTSLEVIGNIFELPCNPDYNGECIVCDCWPSDCPLRKTYNEND